MFRKNDTTNPANAASTSNTQAANPPVTFDVNDPAFQAIVSQAVAARLAAMKPEKATANKMSIAGKSERAIKNELQTIKAFKKIGVTATPHVDVFTFNLWVKKGFRPIEGSKSVRVNNLRLFHKSQCRPITKDELKALKESQEAAVARHAAKVVPIGTGASPQ
jgi:predicted transcriptional regulator